MEIVMNNGERSNVFRALIASLLPNQLRPIRILRGPFRGAVVVMNPRKSMRKTFGIYEHELNPWLEQVLQRVSRVIDVGANDGYFTFGCAAAFRRLRKNGQILSFEPQQQHMDTLQSSLTKQPFIPTKITLLQKSVGCEVGSGVTTLDAIRWDTGEPNCRTGTLIKIDVEGSELEVLRGASSWLKPTNYFVIEIHEESLLAKVERLFALQRLRLHRVDQRPLPLIGREMRSERNWWLVSKIGDSRFSSLLT
jgi:hypothetical protein